MDYEKTSESLDNVLDKTEKKVATMFDRNLNFIKNLRKYMTNEYKLFEGVIINKAIQLGFLLIFIELVLNFFGYISILGVLPKVIAVLLLITYKNRDTLRRKK